MNWKKTLSIISNAFPYSLMLPHLMEPRTHRFSVKFPLRCSVQNQDNEISSAQFQKKINSLPSIIKIPMVVIKIIVYRFLFLVLLISDKDSRVLIATSLY